MTNLVDTDSFDNVYQLETTDDVIGGHGGTSNLQPQQLANRTRWLLNRLRDGGAARATDTGAANAYVANISPAITTLTDGLEISFRAAHANTGASTFTPASGTITALPIYGGDHAALIGGEIVLNGEVKLRYNASLNTPNGAWVVVNSTGGTLHAATPAVGNSGSELATMAAIFAACNGLANINVGVGTDVTLTKSQYGNAALKLNGTPSANINLVLPTQTGVWLVANAQGGSNTITAKMATGTGVVVPAGQACIIYSDGTNVAFAVEGLTLASANALYARLAANNTFTKAQRGQPVVLPNLTGSAAIDFSAANNFYGQVTGNLTFDNGFTNAVAGQSGIIRVQQHGSTLKNWAFGTYWKFVGGSAMIPAQTQTLGAYDEVIYHIHSATEISFAVRSNVA